MWYHGGKRRGVRRERGGHFQRGQHMAAYDTRVLKLRGPANLAGAWSAQPVPASPRPPRAAHSQSEVIAQGDALPASCHTTLGKHGGSDAIR